MKRKFEFFALKGGSSSNRDDNSTEAHRVPVIIQPSEFHKCSECGQVFRSRAALVDHLEEVSVSADKKKERAKVDDQIGNNNIARIGGQAGPSVLAALQPAAVELRLLPAEPAVELRILAAQPALELRLFTDPLELTLRPPPGAVPPRPQPLDLNLPAENDSGDQRGPRQ